MPASNDDLLKVLKDLRDGTVDGARRVSNGSSSDRSYFQQNIINEVGNSARSAMDAYFQQQQHFIATGASGTAMYPAIAQLQQSQTNAGFLGAGLGAAGAVASVWNPAVGALVAAGGGLASNMLSQQANINFAQQAQIANVQMLANNIGLMTGENGANMASNLLNGANPYRIGVISEQLQAQQSLMQMSPIFGGRDMDYLRRLTTSALAPEGDPSASVRIGGGMAAVAGLDYRSMGMSPEDYVRGKLGAMTQSENALSFYQRMARVGGVTYSGSSMDMLMSGYAHNAGDGNWNALSDSRQRKMMQMAMSMGVGRDGTVDHTVTDPGGMHNRYRVNYRISDEDLQHLFENEGAHSTQYNCDIEGLIKTTLALGGRSGAMALRNALPPELQGKLTSALGSDFQQFVGDQYKAQSFGIAAQMRYATGSVMGKDGSVALMRSASERMSAAAEYVRGAAFDKDGNIVSEEAAIKYEQMAQQAQQMKAVAFDQQYAVGGAKSALSYARAQASLSDYGTFGDTRSIQSGYASLIAGTTKDVERAQNRLAQGTNSPEQEAQLRVQIIESLQREKEARANMLRSLDDANIRIANFGVSSASSMQQAGNALGVGGSGGLGLAMNTYGQLANQYQAAQKKTGDIYNQLRQSGQSDAQIQNNEVYRKAKAEQDAAYANGANAYAGLGSVGNSIGIRREQSSAGFEYTLQNMIPGAFGNVYGSGRKLMDTISKAQQEDSGNMQRLEQEGMLNGPYADVIRAGFQEREQQRKLQYAGVMQDLSVNWSGRLMSEVVNAPDRMGYISPQMSFRAAVGAGVKNPGFGSSTQDLDGSWMTAMQFGSMAGGSGTSEGLAATLLSGGSERGSFGGPAIMRSSSGVNNGPVQIMGTLRLNGDGTATILGTMNSNDRLTRSNTIDTSAGGITEMLNSYGWGNRSH